MDFHVPFEFLQEAASCSGMTNDCCQTRLEGVILDKMSLHARVGIFKFVNQLTESVGRDTDPLRALRILAQRVREEDICHLSTPDSLQT